MRLERRRKRKKTVEERRRRKEVTTSAPIDEFRFETHVVLASPAREWNGKKSRHRLLRKLERGWRRWRGERDGEGKGTEEGEGRDEKERK